MTTSIRKQEAESLTRILFVPTTGRQIEQFALVKYELERGSNVKILAIALDERQEALLKERAFSCKSITDYKTRNVLDILKKERPDIVVTNDQEFVTRALIFAANYLGIPSLHVDDGVTFNPVLSERTPRELSMPRIAKWIIYLFLSLIKNDEKFHPYHKRLFMLATLRAVNSPLQFLVKLRREIILEPRLILRSHPEGVRFAVMGSYAKDAYLGMGVDSDRVFITGQPRFDAILERKFSRGMVMKELGIPENKGLIVLATGSVVGWLWEEKQLEELMETLINAMAEFPDKQLVIKLHPAEEIEEYQKILEKIGGSRVILCRDTDIHQLLYACDLLLTIHSTVALEAMIFNKPVITINFSGKPDLMPYAESGAAIGVYRKKDLLPAMKRALYDPQIRKNLGQKSKRFVSEHVYKLDGQASKRVAELIVRLIEEAQANKKGGILV